MPDPEILPPGGAIEPYTPPDPRDQIIREMADEIREMDQAIFNMSQCGGGWHQMQPIFAELLARTERRRRAESDRITNILRRELISVYAKLKG